MNVRLNRNPLLVLAICTLSGSFALSQQTPPAPAPAPAPAAAPIQRQPPANPGMRPGMMQGRMRTGTQGRFHANMNRNRGNFHGGMAGGSNVWPRLFVALYEAAAAHDVTRTAALQQIAMHFDNAVYRSAQHSANPLRGLKCALSILGICSTDVTAPLRPYSREEREQVEKYLHGVNVLAAPHLKRFD